MDKSQSRHIQTELFRKLIKASTGYFGPATERFLEAQIEHVLHKTPAELTPHDIPKLVDWLSLCVSMISNDTDKITQYVERVSKLGRT